MDRSMREDRYSNRRQRENNPSFSSTLLDAIYRSIDEGEDELVLYRETMRKTRSGGAVVHGGGEGDNDEEVANLRRARLIEKWMEKKVSEKVVIRRKSAADLQRKPQFPSSSSSSMFMNSSSSSSDSSSGGGCFSSSEAESTYFASHKPKPIRTSLSEPKKLINLKHMDHDIHMFDTFPDVNEQKAKQQNSFVKTKSKAMKIYGDLKKVKQPISPGGRLASFLNSLFTAGNPKKAKISSSKGEYTEKNSDHQSSKYSKSTAYSSTCTSASSFSRSCLSNTPSSRGKSSNGVKRSVRFCPVSVVVGEDLQPCGQRSLYKDDIKSEKNRNLIRDSVDGELKLLIMEKNRRVEEVARDLLKNYQKKAESEFNRRNVKEFAMDDDEDDDDDGASCASSDLFELDNLSAIGIERYREELPVYETTHFDTNRAIAKGLIC